MRYALALILSLWGSVPAKGSTDIYRYWHNHAEVQSLCGKPLSKEVRQGFSITQQFKGCQIEETISFVVRGRPHHLPPPPPTAPPTAPPTPTVAPPTPTVTPTPVPTATPDPATSWEQECQSSGQSCDLMILGWMNAERTAPVLQLDPEESTGGPGCDGALGHARAMAASGTIWHDNPSYPQDSFPSGLCPPYRAAGQNVGVAATGNLYRDLVMIHQEMQAEPYTPGCNDNHHCNWMSGNYSSVGIAFAEGTYAGLPAVYLVEDFKG